MRSKTAFLTALSVLLGAVCGGPATAMGQGGSTLSAVDQCMLAALAKAHEDTTVAQLKAQCSSDQSASATRAEAASTMPTFRERLRTVPAQLLPEAIEFSEMLKKPLAQRSIVERRVVSEIHAFAEEFALLPHRPNYVLPLTGHSRPNRLPDPPAGPADARQSTEAHFQTSFKFPVTPPLLGGRALPFFAYTGRAWWQVYDADRSRPFREYNHEPEFFVALTPTRLSFAGWRHRFTTVGFAHQSNGRSAPTSRSWNRLFAEVHADYGADYWAALKLWYRVPEQKKGLPTDQFGDDNPDITRYLGRGQLKLGHISDGGNHFTLTARQALRSDGKGALQIDWSRPTGYSPSLRWYIQGFAGYGDSLIDYNQRVHRLGFGMMLNDWF